MRLRPHSADSTMLRRWRLQVSLSVSRLSPSCLTSLSIPFHHLRPMRHYPHLWISARGLGLSGTSTHLTRQLSGTHYGLLRPCAPLRYSRPHGWSRLWLVPSRRQRDEAQVLTFHTKAWSSFAPPTCRMPPGPYQASPELIPEEGSPPVLTSPNPLSTLHRRFACARLSRPCRLDFMPRLDCNAHHHGFCPQQLTVAWDQRLIAEP